MPKAHVKQDPVSCENCHDPIQRTRQSRSGKYFCSKPDCRAAKQREYRRERKALVLDDAEQFRKTSMRAGADFLHAALWATRVPCPRCGLTNALKGYAHFGPDGAGCDGTGGGRVEGVTLDHALAVWPYGKREFAG